MTDVKFIEKKGASLSALADTLKSVEDKKNPVAIQQQVKDYAVRFSKLNISGETKLIKAIQDLEIPLVTDSHIVQIVNLMPESANELQTVFAGSRTTVSSENMSKLLEVIKANGK